MRRTIYFSRFLFDFRDEQFYFLTFFRILRCLAGYQFFIFDNVLSIKTKIVRLIRNSQNKICSLRNPLWWALIRNWFLLTKMRTKMKWNYRNYISDKKLMCLLSVCIPGPLLCREYSFCNHCWRLPMSIILNRVRHD